MLDSNCQDARNSYPFNENFSAILDYIICDCGLDCYTSSDMIMARLQEHNSTKHGHSPPL